MTTPDVSPFDFVFQGLPEPVRSRRDRGDDRRDSRDSRARGPSNNSDAASGKGGGIHFTIDKQLIGGQWAVESDSDNEEDEDQKRNRRTWKDEKKVGLENESSVTRQVFWQIRPGQILY